MFVILLMFVILFLIILFVICLILGRSFSDIFFIGNLTIGILLFICAFTILVNFYCVKSDLASFEQIRTTLFESRKNMSDSERAAMVLKMADKNAWLRNVQYWNNTIFDLWIPDEVNTTPFLSLKK